MNALASTEAAVLGIVKPENQHRFEPTAMTISDRKAGRKAGRQARETRQDGSALEGLLISSRYEPTLAFGANLFTLRPALCSWKPGSSSFAPTASLSWRDYEFLIHIMRRI